MLLDLLQAGNLATSAYRYPGCASPRQCPATTALRWMKTMSEQGLFVRRADPHDGRRMFVELAPEASKACAAISPRSARSRWSSGLARRAAPWQRDPPRALSSVGRASRLHREGRRFEPVSAHQVRRSPMNGAEKAPGKPPRPRRRRGRTTGHRDRHARTLSDGSVKNVEHAVGPARRDNSEPQVFARKARTATGREQAEDAQLNRGFPRHLRSAAEQNIIMGNDDQNDGDRRRGHGPMPTIRPNAATARRQAEGRSAPASAASLAFVAPDLRTLRL